MAKYSGVCICERDNTEIEWYIDETNRGVAWNREGTRKNVVNCKEVGNYLIIETNCPTCGWRVSQEVHKK